MPHSQGPVVAKPYQRPVTNAPVCACSLINTAQFTQGVGGVFFGQFGKIGAGFAGGRGGCVSAMGSIFAATLRIWAVLRGCARQGTWDRGKIVSNLRINPAPCLTYLGTGSRIFSVPVLAQPAWHTQWLWRLLFDAAYCCAPYAAIRINVNFGAKKVALALKLALLQAFLHLCENLCPFACN